MIADTPKIHVCICTYDRVVLLSRLIDDIFTQTIHADALIIVDGDPHTGQVRSMLCGKKIPSSSTVLYIASNHANLAYQRYMGWKSSQGADILVYLDDDLRIPQKDAIEKTIAPLLWAKGDVVGVTAITKEGSIDKYAKEQILVERAKSRTTMFSPLIDRLGAASNLSPGSLSPSGHRKFPLIRGREYEETQWLQGRVMAYSLSSLTQECFVDDLFALTHIHCGLGEDTVLSHRVQAKGKLLMAFCAEYEHPNDALPNSYPTEAFRLGYATSYSRRLLNDHFHGTNRPKIFDRIDLVKSYIGTSIINWSRAITSSKQHLFAYASGYTLGALRGLLQKPTARNLTRHIDWWKDAEQALSNVLVIQKGSS